VPGRLADSPHIVTGDVIVSEGVTLTIESGVTVKFLCLYSAYPCDTGSVVHGTLNAQGTSTDTIRCTTDSVTTAKGD
jgi:hypothetical protein